MAQMNIDSLYNQLLKEKTDNATINKYLQHIDSMTTENYNEIEITGNWIIDNASNNGNEQAKAGALNVLGNMYLSAEKIKEAMECYTKAIDICKKNNDYKNLSRAYIGMYNFHKQSNQYDIAAVFVNNNLKLSEQYNYLPGIAKSKYGMAALFDDHLYPEKKDTFNLTFKLMNEARDIWAKLKDTAQMYRTQIGIAEALSNYGLYDTAIATLENIKEILVDAFQQNFAAPYFFTLGKIYNEKAGAFNENKEYHLKAIENFNNAIEYAKMMNNSKYLLWSYNWLATSYRFIDDYKNAYQYKKRYSNLNDSLLDAGYLQSLSSAQHKYEQEKKEKEIIKKNILNKILIGGAVALLLIGLLGYRNFIIKQKFQQQQITELEKDKQLLAIDAMLKGQEEERSRLAKDLHDGLGGMLSGVKLSFVNMKENMVMDAESVSSFENSIMQLDNTIAELRKVAHNLMPEALVKFGLTNAILDFCNSMQLASKTKIIFEPMGTERQLSNTADLYVYRIIQELINNAIKHAAPNQILVQLTKTTDKVLLTVEDDGKGFNKELLQSATGIGMKNLQQRVDYFKGKIDFASQPGEGTSVNIELIT